MKIVMLGTGYVGLVTGTCFSEFGYEVICVDKDNKKILMAAQSGKFTAFKASELLKYNILNPLLGFKVMSAILFEAMRIIFKGGKYYARKKKPKDTISFEGSF